MTHLSRFSWTLWGIVIGASMIVVVRDWPTLIGWVSMSQARVWSGLTSASAGEVASHAPPRGTK